ncbi:MAG TPA: phosphoenolpyruvate synthase [Candidatus Dependentiae bacterium]|nr:phosphoenolpyruvate synthase [Candidatus Dependentiae bacterium]HRQ62394.1 phosphoenolpyruvate synthase [Candidatus Dependentiae bacterium]
MKILHCVLVFGLFVAVFAHAEKQYIHKRNSLMEYIKTFEDITMKDLPLVGGKNASLGEMISQLMPQGILVPTGFAVTAQAYRYFLDYNKLREPMQKLMDKFDAAPEDDLKVLDEVGGAIRALIEGGDIPSDLQEEILQAYRNLSERYGVVDCDVAVRSSATAEDLPDASFAGQQETYLNIRGDKELLHAYKRCLASLFTNRAIVYRRTKGFDHFEVALSVGVQKMIRSDLASSGVAFSIDTESGFKDVVIINSSYGLGETIVQGLVTPDEFVVFKPTLEQGFAPIIKKQLGDKKVKMIYTKHADKPVELVDTTIEELHDFSLSDEEVLVLARAVNTVEKYYSQVRGTWTPMDVEWAKDGDDGKIYIIQARPETIHGKQNDHNVVTQFTIENGSPEQLATSVLVTGQSIGQRIAHGVVRVIKDVSGIHQVQKGDIIVTDMTDPDWVPAMKKSAGIITNRGGRTCHAAIVSRELNIPAIVGAEGATRILKDGQEITLDCSRGSIGYVYDGKVPFKTTRIELDTIPQLPVHVMVNLADPDSAFAVSALPVAGVGLMRLEFIIPNAIKVHPMALIHPERVTDKKIREEIDDITKSYANKPAFFVDKLAESIGKIAAAFYPRPVIVRTSDFKSNEYRGLVGGTYFEPVEENPMIGFRGASRYYNERYKEAFALECAALKKVREEMGLTNVKVMIPFVRTLEEADKVLAEMDKNGLIRGQNGLEVIMMCEIPSNVLLVDDFSKRFDGFSIGSNDLTQMTLGVDRDSEILAASFDERDPAAKKMMQLAVEGAKRNKKYIGICGQGPSDHPEIATFLMEQGIDSLSLNPDTVLPFLMRYNKK